MTDCHTIQAQLNALLDGELSTAEGVAVSAHLKACGTCATAFRELEQLNQHLRSWGSAQHLSAQRVASQVLTRHAAHSTVVRALPEQNGRGKGRSLVALLVSCVAVLLVACVLYLGRNDQQPATPLTKTTDTARDPLSETLPAAVAHITAATGPISSRSSVQADWQLVSLPDNFQCHAGMSLRTSDEALCELETAAGAIVRMNHAAVITLDSANQVNLSAGEIYCSAGPEQDLNINANFNPSAAGATEVLEPTIESDVSSSFPLFCCPVASVCSVSTDLQTNETRATCSGGELEVSLGTTKTRLTPGSAVVLREGAFAAAPSEETLLATRWTLPLLRISERRQDEVQQRVNALLSRLGQTKASFLYEDQIRELGEPGSWPLIRFLQQPDTGNQTQRHNAASILSQTATVSMVGDLLPLLHDTDPNVRMSIAAALQRITDLHANLPPDNWSKLQSPECEQAERDWTNWWSAHRAAQ